MSCARAQNGSTAIDAIRSVTLSTRGSIDRSTIGRIDCSHPLFRTKSRHQSLLSVCGAAPGASGIAAHLAYCLGNCLGILSGDENRVVR